MCVCLNDGVFSHVVSGSVDNFYGGLYVFRYFCDLAPSSRSLEGLHGHTFSGVKCVT